jgi:hypothetical protein
VFSLAVAPVTWRSAFFKWHGRFIPFSNLRAYCMCHGLVTSVSFLSITRPLGPIFTVQQILYFPYFPKAPTTTCSHQEDPGESSDLSAAPFFPLDRPGLSAESNVILKFILSKTWLLFENCIHVAQNAIQWWDFVWTVMNLRLHKMREFRDKMCISSGHENLRRHCYSCNWT